MKEEAMTGNGLPFSIKFLLIMANSLKPLFGGPLPGLEQLAKRAAAAESLTVLVRRELPVPLGEHVVSASRRDEDLVVIVDSAAWAARVRYAGPRLRERLAELAEPVTGKVRVRVRSPRKRADGD
jgi:hypothetical protein